MPDSGEEDKVPGAQLGTRHMAVGIVLRIGRMRHLRSYEFGIDVCGEAGAIESGGRGATPDIWDTAIAEGFSDDLAPKTGTL